ncbi:MAG TPA: hypothetical protein VL970_14365 [Candidatus Acidoferrales bacterium]|nr:hypothetical protein [Candidatus Acidoferrales bacterium]
MTIGKYYSGGEVCNALVANTGLGQHRAGSQLELVVLPAMWLPASPNFSARMRIPSPRRACYGSC